MRRSGKAEFANGIEVNETSKASTSDVLPYSRITSPRRRINSKGRVKVSVLCCLVLGGTLLCLCSLACLSLYLLSFSSHDNEVVKEKRGEYLEVTELAPSCDMSVEVDDVSYTLVTQVSIDRMWMMEYHCKRWGNHPLSVAVLTQKTREEIIMRLIELGCSQEDLTAEVLDAKLYPEDDYPVNILRNLALKGVKTSHVVFVDVDFWESEGMWETLMTEDIRKALVDDHQLALVLPAFQLFRQCEYGNNCKKKNIDHMPSSLYDLATMIKKEQGQIFDPTNKGGHGSTRYRDWFFQEPSSLLELECVLSNRYEPFLVFRYCHDLPPFQEQFSGYGKNKMTWVMQLIRSGYRLSQVGGVYLCHYPHLDSKSRRNWNASPEALLEIHQDTKGHKYRLAAKDVHEDFSQYKRGLVDQEFVKFRNWLQASIPDQTRLPRCEEAQDDDAKLWIDRTKSDVADKEISDGKTS